MNQGILAARTQEAFASIENEVRRLGGDLTITTTRGDAAHRQLHTLEAIAAALGGIGVQTPTGAGNVADSDVTETPTPPAVDEPPAPRKATPKGKGL